MVTTTTTTESQTKRWQSLIGAANMQDLYDARENRIAFTVNNNRKHGPSRKFKNRTSPLGDNHHLVLHMQLAPNKAGDAVPECVVRILNVILNDFGALLGGQGEKSIKKTFKLSDKTEFARLDEDLQRTVLDLFEALLDQAPARELKQVRILGTESNVDFGAALRAAAASPGEWNLFRAPCAGTVTAVIPAENGSPGCIRVTAPVEENGLITEENIHRCDETVILPGTKPCVKEGQVITIDDNVLQIDEAALSTLTESQLGDLTFFIKQLEDMPEVSLDADLVVNGVSFYEGLLGNLVEDVAPVVDANGCPIIQVVIRPRNSIFQVGHLYVRVGPTDHRFAWKNRFVVVTPRERVRAEAGARKRELKAKGPKGALVRLLAEALNLEAQDSDKKLGLLSSGPFPLDEKLMLRINKFSLAIKFSPENERLAPKEIAAKIDGFLEELLNEVKTPIEDAS